MVHSQTDTTAGHYRKCGKLARGKSLLAYIGQSLGCFVLLGPFVSYWVLHLWQYLRLALPKLPEIPLNGWLFWAFPIGFLLSLTIDASKAPLKSCWPLGQFSSRASGSLVPNRTFFAPLGCPPRVFAGRTQSLTFWFWLSLGLGSLAILGSNALFLLLRQLFPKLPTSQIDEINQIFAQYSKLQAFIMLVISPVIFEELVYRGRGFALLSRYWGNGGAVAITSLTFALSHASPTEVISLLPLAFYLGWLRWRSGNLAFTMLVHLQNNGLAFLWQFWFPYTEGSLVELCALLY